MTEGGEDDGKGMVSDVEVVRSLGGTEMLSSMRDEICVCVAVVARLMVAVTVAMIAVMVVVMVDGSSESSGVGDTGESIVYRSGGGGGSIVYRSGGGGLCSGG